MQWLLYPGLPLAAILAVSAFLRFWQLDAVGFNSDEAVYTGSAASIAGNTALAPMFPVFRAHPLLFQTLLSLVLRVHGTDFSARAFAASAGVAAVALTYLLGQRLYGKTAGLLAALVLAVMPYHVVVSRQVLLDGLMTCFAIVVFYCVARYVESGRLSWLLACSNAMSLAILSKETSAVLLGSLYVFFALTPTARLRVKQLWLALLLLMAEVAIWPVMLRLAGYSRTGQNYLLWQLFRRPNHEILFYFTVLPSWIGPAVLAAAAAGLIRLRREATWRERLLLAWLAVPVLFFTVWPVKGFQYLLPVSPCLAVLAGRFLARPFWLNAAGRLAAGVLAVATAVSLAVPAWARSSPASSRTFLAGTGGMIGGREAGNWVLDHVPQSSRLLAIGPSIANVLEFYGHRRVSALSISTNPRNRNPSYVPVVNPDLALRSRVFQYIVWDAYTASHSRFFAAEAIRLARKYHGTVAYATARKVADPSRPGAVRPAVVIYQVHP